MGSKDAAVAAEFISVYWKEIVEKWVAFFVYKQTDQHLLLYVFSFVSFHYLKRTH